MNKRTDRQTDRQTGCKRDLKSKKAFTLVELLVVIAIIGILFVVLISKVDFATDKAKTAGVQTDFRSYQMAMKMVGMEQQGFTNDMNDLAAQLNKNLDPKLQVAVVDGKLATEAEDPWGTAYQFTYGEPANTRGEIVVRSAGPDLQYNTDDDIIIVSRYEFGVNGGGVVEATESINPLVLYAAPGLYDPDTNQLTKTWDELLDEEILIVTGTTLMGNYDKLNLINGVLSIQDGITEIGNYAFMDDNAGSFASNLSGIILPDSVTSIGEGAFLYCTSLPSVIIPNGVISIGNGAFGDCSSLMSVTIGNGVATIGMRAFGSCSSLTSVTIPDSVTSIGQRMIEDCDSLTSVTVLATTPPECEDYALYYCPALTSIYVPASAVDAYKTADGWKDFASLIKPIQ